MHKYIKVLSSILLALTLSACASTSSKHQQPKLPQLSENLSVAPAIDVPYSEVNKNIKENVGLNIRWGGKIVSAKKVGDVTELTVLANRLAQDSRPIPKADDDFSDQRFIIVVPEYEHSLLRQYITVYGEVSGERSLVNGPKTRVIPVITAIETMEWNSVTLDEQVILAKSNVDRRRPRFNSFNRFDNRGFSRFGRLNRFGRQSHFGSFGRFGRFDSFGRTRFGRFDSFGRTRFGRFGRSKFGGGFHSGSRFGRGRY